MSRRVTIKDIARQTNLSVTTVTKAINNKTKVSEETKRLVLDTVKQMKYVPNRSARAMASREMKIAVIFPKYPPEFVTYIEQGFQRGASELFDFRVNIQYVRYDNPNEKDGIINSLSQLDQMKPDGVIMFSGRDPSAYQDMIQQNTEKGIPFLFVVTEVENVGGIGTIRLNSEVSGAVASQFLQLTVPEKKHVAIMVGNKDLKVHSRCVDGFLSMSKRLGQHIYGIFETNDDKEIAYHLMQKLASECPDLGGVYVSSYNSVGVCQWLEDYNRQGTIKIIGHDLYPALVEKLENGTLTATLYQNQFEYGRISIHYMYEYLAKQRKKAACSKLMTPQLVLMSNVSCFKHCY